VAEWGKLRDVLIKTPYLWEFDRTNRAIRLTGYCPHTNVNSTDVRVIAWRKYMQVIRDKATFDSCRGSIATAVPGKPVYLELKGKIEACEERLKNTSVPEVNAAMIALIDEEVEDVKRKQLQVRDQVEAPAQACAKVEALIDNTPEAARLHRYENMNELAYHRNYNAILRHRRHSEKLLPEAEEQEAGAYTTSMDHHDLNDMFAGARGTTRSQAAEQAASVQNEPNEIAASVEATDICASSDVCDSDSESGVQGPVEASCDEGEPEEGFDGPCEGPPPTA
jgi:hypothetical protein